MTIKRLSYYLLILLVSGSILSCKKGEITYDFEGHIIESVGNTPLAGVEVTISQILFSSSVANYNYQPGGSGTSDSNGDWSISFKREKVTDFRIEMKKDGYFDKLIEFTSGDATIEDPNIHDVTIDAEAWVIFDLENLSPMPGDQLSMVLMNFREDCQGCGVNTFYYFHDDLDTNLLFKTTAGKYNRFQLNDVNSATLIDDSILTIPFDTVTYSFSY
jgi:hypothetical protein